MFDLSRLEKRGARRFKPTPEQNERDMRARNGGHSTARRFAGDGGEVWAFSLKRPLLTNEGHVLAEAGAWVVTHADGSRSLLREDLFAARFSPLEDEAVEED